MLSIVPWFLIPGRGLAPQRVALVLCGMDRPFDSGEVSLL
jgi:hypothetical protein